MKMIKAIVRPEKVDDIMSALIEKGFNAATRMAVLGKGKQKGLKIGEVYYDELPKELIMIVVDDKDQDVVTRIIIDNAKIDKKGNYGDGKVFISDVEDAITISTGVREL
ncbi:Nitrogen regulatory protein PII [Clostridium bornimense]|uniref:Nitrogen regulatory protein PII n=1 Tax=Clostridium bornimense TaxID=1216932 RepID=W6S7A0_9CLOT|nr:P-II family nitrogen regulator [Clostridium bornimense]CDM70287.1 Nitrogen regulatory protein PII [Clostridium bornimense]